MHVVSFEFMLFLRVFMPMIIFRYKKEKVKGYIASISVISMSFPDKGIYELLL